MWQPAWPAHAADVTSSTPLLHHAIALPKKYPAHVRLPISANQHHSLLYCPTTEGYIFQPHHLVITAGRNGMPASAPTHRFQGMRAVSCQSQLHDTCCNRQTCSTFIAYVNALGACVTVSRNGLSGGTMHWKGNCNGHSLTPRAGLATNVRIN